MKPEEELEIINRLIREEQELHNKNKKKLKEDEKKKVYKELWQDKILGILGG